MSVSGNFTSSWQDEPDMTCRYCGERRVQWRRWKARNRAFEDSCYQCLACRQVWWVFTAGNNNRSNYGL